MMRNWMVATSLGLMLLMSVTCNAVVKDKAQNKPKPLVTFVELGSVNCTPCKMMKPVMEAVEKEYGDKIDVIFHDVNKNRQIAAEYKIRVIPTQVFLNARGKEFYRHEGFFPQEEVMKIVDKQLGIKRHRI